MTPLAHRIAKELALPAHRRTIQDHSGILRDMSDIRCFEVSEVIGTAKAMMGMGEKVEQVAEASCFLPAPKTWIEWAGGNGPSHRLGFLLQHRPQDGYAKVTMAGFGDYGLVSPPTGFLMPLIGSGDRLGYEVLAFGDQTGRLPQALSVTAFELIAALAFINTPKLIGRIDHAAHRGLKKKIRATMGERDDFKFHPWTEIKLHLTPPEGVSGGDRSPLTGQRALHFCRSHLRLRNGKLEIVRAHMRGNVAAGVKQSSYRVLGEVKP